MPEFTLKERCQRRLEGLKDSRKGFEAEAKEIAAYAAPARSRWLASDTNKGRQPNRRLNNSHGIFAFRTLQGGMTSGLTSESRPWKTLTTFDEGMKENPEVRRHLADVDRRMDAFLAQTNFYQEVKTGYLELGLFGTEACIALPHPTEGMVCHQLTFGEYWLGMGDTRTPEALYRECPMTVKVAVETFKDAVDPRIMRLYDTANYDATVTFFHAIEPNDQLDAERLDFRGKPWRSVYWDPQDSSKERFVQRQGFDEQPFWAPRWDTTGGDVWGQGPGHDALPDLRELQLQTKRKAEATDLHIHPEQVASSRVKLKRMPRNVVTVAGQDLDVSKLVSVPYQVDYNAILAIREDIETNKRAIDAASFAELFMAISTMEGSNYKNIEEVTLRNEEKLTQLGPVIQRVNNEKLEVAVERIYGIMERAGLLPPPPEAMREAPELKIEFVSILTQMQRMAGLGQTERAVGFVGGLMGVWPEARLKVDVNELIDDYWARAGAPQKALRPSEDAQADADAEAQNAQAAAAAEAAGKMAPAASVGVDAAQLLADTPAALTPAVADLVPLLPR